MEDFFRNKSITQEKKHKSRTYLIIDEESTDLLAYFSLTFKEIRLIKDNIQLPKNKIQDLHGFNRNADQLNCYLIGQIGKNFSIENNTIRLPEIMEYAYAIIKEAQDRVGGRVILIECADDDKLKELYSRIGFAYLQKGDLVQMVKSISA